MKFLHKTIQLAYPTQPLTLIPFGCVHHDEPGFRESLFRQCLQEIMETPQCYAIGLGDYSSFVRATARKHLKSYTADEDAWRELDSMVKTNAIAFYRDYLEPLAKKGKLIGLAEGNHYYTFQNSTTDTQFLCELAKVPYLDKPCFLRLKVVMKGGHAKVFKVLIHHGDWSGGYARIGGDMNSLEMRGLGFDCDIFIASHTHRLFAVHVPVLTIPSSGTLRPIERPKVFIRSGCFIAGYDAQCSNYVQRRLLPPTALGYARLEIKFYQEYDKERANEARKKSRHPETWRGARCGNIKYKFRVQY